MNAATSTSSPFEDADRSLPITVDAGVDTQGDVRAQESQADPPHVLPFRASSVGETTKFHAERSVSADGSSGARMWNAGDRRFVSVVVATAIVLLATHWIRLTGWTPVAIEVVRPDGDAYRFRLEINTATWVEWMQLEGVGETLARRIVADRDEHGPFPDVESLRRVSGIGPKTLDRMRPHLTVAPEVTQDAGD
ncbi:MAG: helix-hairpin-helix domain-containing protein [Planctomycetaceae bacterium]|nr:helix-hairpin-helix domain-containing protein [Planctomycetaceae bacterium]